MSKPKRALILKIMVKEPKWKRKINLGLIRRKKERKKTLINKKLELRVLNISGLIRSKKEKK